MTTPTTCLYCGANDHAASDDVFDGIERCLRSAAGRLTAPESALAKPPGQADGAVLCGAQVFPFIERTWPGQGALCLLPTGHDGEHGASPPAPAESPGDGAPVGRDFLCSCGHTLHPYDVCHARNGGSALPCPCLGSKAFNPTPPPAPAAPSAEAKTCEPWCGKSYQDKGVPVLCPHMAYGTENPLDRVYCTPACRDAGRPMRPASAISKTETGAEPQPAAAPVPCTCRQPMAKHVTHRTDGPCFVTEPAAPAPVTSDEAHDALDGVHPGTSGIPDMVLLRRFVDQRESVEAALRDELQVSEGRASHETFRADEAETLKSHADAELVRTIDECNALRAELAKLERVTRASGEAGAFLGKKVKELEAELAVRTVERDAYRAERDRPVAPAGTGTNRDDICDAVGCTTAEWRQRHGTHIDACNDVKKLVDAAETRGREAALPEKVRAEGYRCAEIARTEHERASDLTGLDCDPVLGGSAPDYVRGWKDCSKYIEDKICDGYAVRPTAPALPEVAAWRALDARERRYAINLLRLDGRPEFPIARRVLEALAPKKGEG